MNNGASLHGRAVAAEAVEPVPVSPVPASIPSATVKESVGDVTLFSVRNGWEWGDIFVRPSKDGAEVVAHSSFGTFGYNWIAMGGDWREFLLSCSREYAMRKLAGHFYDAPLSRDEFVATMRKELDDYEESVIDAWGILDPDQERRIKLCRDALDDDWGWEDVPVEALFWHFNERASGAPYALELYETRMTKINPQVVGFWETIWEPFGDYLAQAIEARRAETTGTVEDESAVRIDENHSAVIVLVRDGDPDRKPLLYVCGKCGSVHSPRIYLAPDDVAHETARKAAEDCYNCKTHSECRYCGAECHKGWQACDACRYAKALEAAVEVPDTGGPYCAFDGDTYYSDLDEARDDGREWVSPCEITYPRIDPDDVLDGLLSDMHEDASVDDLDAVDAFYAAVEAFNKAQKTQSWWGDNKRKIAVPKDAP